MDVSAISNNSLDIQSLLLNDLNGAGRVNRNNPQNQTAEYAKKGEPMYMADMDSDEDGVVSLDEFKDYCKDKGINTKQMVKMSQLAASFRTMQAENETIDYISKLIPNAHPNLKQADSNSSLHSDEGKYNISNDTNNPNKVAYKEYMEFCDKNAVSEDLKSEVKVEETDDGNLSIIGYGKALASYGKSERNTIQSTFKEDI
ncbi:hypothetical protein IJ843_08330 [bacterium]|nr:hypothetical protein [bacterium]